MAFNELMNKSKEKLSDMNELRKKRAAETHVIIKTATQGITEVSRQVDGLCYIGKNDSVLYEAVNCEWTGPQFTNVTRTETKGTNKGKTKKKGRLTGAVVGTVLLPGAGTLIGAMAGTGNKKHKGENQSTSITYDEQVEVDAPGFIRLKNTETNDIVSLTFSCKSDTYTKISSLCPVEIYQNQNSPNNANIEVNEVNSSDPYEEIKKMKELLDMGIISQEEFDLKKKELFNL